MWTGINNNISSAEVDEALNHVSMAQTVIFGVCQFSLTPQPPHTPIMTL